jgi:hypothetical protein
VRSISDIDAANGKAIVESKQLNNFYTTLFLSENGKFKPIPLDGMIQYSTIQDIEINNQGDMIYVANSNNMITELGQNSGLSGGILSQYDSETQQFTSDEALNLPFDINTRQILDLDESRYLILCNDDYQYIINKPSVE